MPTIKHVPNKYVSFEEPTQLPDQVKNIYTVSFDSSRVYKAYEHEIPYGTKIKFFSLCWKYLTDKKFRWLFTETLLYALRHYHCYRGEGSSDVIMFDGFGYSQRILKFSEKKEI